MNRNMSQSSDLMEQKVANQVVHIRSDSETKLDELFNAVIHPKDYQVPLTVPMRLRNLPPSFFQQPEKGSNSPKVEAGGVSSCLQQTHSGLQINHPRANSSPASLQQTYSKSIASGSHQHLRQRSYGDLLDDNAPLPPGWEKAKTSAGQTYFLNHLTQTTTWVDPRKKMSSANVSPSVNMQSLGELPKGWDQATTLEGEVYFINHLDRTTSWLDPRIPAHLQTPPTVNAPTQQSISSLHFKTDLGDISQQVRQQQQQQRLPVQQSLKQLPPSLALQQQRQQQNLRVQSLEMEREQLRLRQQEIMRQQEMLLRQSLGEKLTLAASPTGSNPDPLSSSLESFLDGSTDFHSRQESADSGLGLGTNYSLPHTPEDFLSNLDDIEDRQSNDLGLDLQTTLDLGDDNMDTDDLVPSLQEELNADILSDVEALLAANKDSVLTWL